MSNADSSIWLSTKETRNIQSAPVRSPLELTEEPPWLLARDPLDKPPCGSAPSWASEIKVLL